MRLLLLAILLSAAPAAAQVTAQGAPAVPSARTPASTAAPPAATSGIAEAARAGATEYVLDAGDVIKVDVVDEPLLTKTYRIETDGTFDYTYLGRVVARGKTTRLLATELIRGLVDGQFVRRPQLTVDIETPRSRFVTVIGEVRQPGKILLLPQMRVVDAITQAGYLTPNAGSRAVVMRGSASPAAATAPAAGAAAPPIEINLNDLQLGKLEQNVELREGDTILVVKAEKFYVTGQVRNTGSQTWERGLTVREALIMAGGVNEKGSSRRVRIIRMINGKEKKIEADATTLVEPEDIVEVPQRLL